ncbi:MAG: LysR family transcriptional regulator [Polaromonas sp.]
MQHIARTNGGGLLFVQTVVAVLETGSITGAAQRLGVTQSAVSHLLDKLRGIIGDPLFVKSGRGIVATARAEELALQARELLRQLQQFAQLDMLRSDDCQLIISPRPPDGSDIVQKRLFEDYYRVFYDAAVRDAPRDQADYLAADHATVVYEPRRSLDLDQYLTAKGIARRFTVMVPSFSALPAFVRGTKLLSTAPSLLARHTLQGLASCPPPVPCPSMPMYLIWHVRYQQDAAHRWLRAQLEAVVKPTLAGVA